MMNLKFPSPRQSETPDGEIRQATSEWTDVQFEIQFNLRGLRTGSNFIN